MTDREKVVQGLEEISDYFFDIYRNDTDSYKCEKAQEYSAAAADAIALLKEQEAEQPIVHENSYGWKFYYCPKCKQEFYQNRKQAYCDKCGKAVKWE